jgi:hypothetical protein
MGTHTHTGNALENTSESKRWVGVGRAVDDDARTAASAAVSQAICRPDGKLLIILFSPEYDHEKLVAGIAEHSGGMACVGCSTTAQIATEGPGEAGVLAIALGGEGFAVGTRSAPARGRLREAGAEAAACLSALPPRDHSAWR